MLSSPSGCDFVTSLMFSIQQLRFKIDEIAHFFLVEKGRPFQITDCLVFSPLPRIPFLLVHRTQTLVLSVANRPSESYDVRLVVS